MTNHARRIRPVVVAAALCIVLSGCGGGEGGDDAPAWEDLTDEARLTSVVQMADRLGALSNTAFAGTPSEFPVSGSATFSGYAIAAFDDAVTVDLIEDLDPNAEPRLLLLGNATLSADFGARTISGEATEFFGREAGSFAQYDGTVVFRDGEIGVDGALPGSRPNDIRFGYSGTLTGAGNEVVLDGDALGKFKGTPIRGLIALDVDTNELNGAPTPSVFGVIAETD
jgi:hypothetical protein